MGLAVNKMPPSYTGIPYRQLENRNCVVHEKNANYKLPQIVVRHIRDQLGAESQHATFKAIPKIFEINI